MTQIFNTAEGGTNGTGVTTANSGGASGTAFNTVTLGTGSTIVFDNSNPIHGSLSYLVTPGAAANASVTLATASSTTGVFRFTGTFTGLPTAAVQLGRFATAGSLVVANVVIDTTGHVIVQGASGTLYTSTGTLSLNTKYTFELSAIPATSTTGTVSMRCRVGDSQVDAVTPFSSTTADLGATAFAKVNFGKISSSGNMAAFIIDDLAVDDAGTAFFGPAQPQYVPQPPRYRGMPSLLRRRTVAQPVPVQVVVTAQALPPQPQRERLIPPFRRRTRPAQPVPAQVVVVTAQALPPQPVRRRLFPQPRRRTFTATVVTVAAPPPPQPVRRRAAPLPRRRVTPVPAQVVVTVTPPPAVSLRRRLRPLARLRRFTAQPVPAGVVVPLVGNFPITVVTTSAPVVNATTVTAPGTNVVGGVTVLTVATTVTGSSVTVTGSSGSTVTVTAR